MTIQWEYGLVERPFCETPQRMGWEWIEGDSDLPLPPLGQTPQLAHSKWTDLVKIFGLVGEQSHFTRLEPSRPFCFGQR